MNAEPDSPRDVLKAKLRRCFNGSIVRKDLTKQLKEGANVPVYVLEYLLGSYCNSDDEAVIADGVEKVKQIVSRYFVRPDESQKVLSLLRQRGTMTIIDRVTVTLSLKDNCYLAAFSNLGIAGVDISDEYACKYERLLCGGIWCKVTLEYAADVDDEDEHLLEACGYRKTAMFSVLSQDIEVSTTITEPGFLMFRRTRLRVAQRFRVSYGVDCAEDAGRCLMFRSAGAPVIEARSPSCRPAGGQEMVSILGRLQEKARYRADFTPKNADFPMSPLAKCQKTATWRHRHAFYLQSETRRRR